MALQCSAPIKEILIVVYHLSIGVWRDSVVMLLTGKQHMHSSNVRHTPIKTIDWRFHLTSVLFGRLYWELRYRIRHSVQCELVDESTGGGTKRTAEQTWIDFGHQVYYHLIQTKNQIKILSVFQFSVSGRSWTSIMDSNKHENCSLRTLKSINRVWRRNCRFLSFHLNLYMIYPYVRYKAFNSRPMAKQSFLSFVIVSDGRGNCNHKSRQSG